MGNITEFATGYPGYNGRMPKDKAGIGAMLRLNGYSTFCVGKWHNTPGEYTGPTGPFDRWPTADMFGFDRFYGFMAGDTNQWYPPLYNDNHPVDPPRTPEEGYHLSEDLVDKSIELIASHKSIEPNKPFLLWLAFGAGHSPHHVWRKWIEKYKGKFDMGWDRYRELVLERQKKMGVVPQNAELSPMLEGVQKWDELSGDEKRLFARMAEVYAGFISHADAQIGRLIDFLEKIGDLENTFIFVFIGDNGSSGEGTLDGLFNEGILGANVPETLNDKLERIDQLGQPGSYNHYPIGWALAGNTPYKLCKQYTHFGGTRNPLVIHWPARIKRKGEIRNQFHHVIDIVPTILKAVGIEMPTVVNSVQQAPIEGVPMNYTFDNPSAPTTHPTQYFEMLGNRALVENGWKVVTNHGRKPWENRSNKSFDDDHWELYNLDQDPSECHDLMENHELTNLKDPMVQKLIQLVGLWWAEAGRYNVLPLDDRFVERMLSGVKALMDASTRMKVTFYPGAVRIPEPDSPNTLNRSWSMTAEIEIPEKGAEGPICATGGDTNGWSLYMKDGKVVYCYNLIARDFTYIRSENKVLPGRHKIFYEFEKTGQQLGAGGVGRIYLDGKKVAEGKILRTVAFGASLSETMDIGCDKGSPVTPEYKARAEFTGKIIKVDFDLKQDLHHDPEKHAETSTRVAMMRQ
jgi:arylsulfatase